MQFLSSRVLLVVGMLFMLAAPHQSDASSILLTPAPADAFTVAACAAGGGTGGEDVCVGAVNDVLRFGIALVIDSAGTNAWSIDLAWDSSLQDALTYSALNSASSLVFPNPTPPPTSINYNVQGTAGEQQSSPSQEGHIHIFVLSFSSENLSSINLLKRVFI